MNKIAHVKMEQHVTILVELVFVAQVGVVHIAKSHVLEVFTASIVEIRVNAVMEYRAIQNRGSVTVPLEDTEPNVSKVS